jgi:hypothetical protein
MRIDGWTPATATGRSCCRSPDAGIAQAGRDATGCGGVDEAEPEIEPEPQRGDLLLDGMPASGQAAEPCPRAGMESPDGSSI